MGKNSDSTLYETPKKAPTYRIIDPYDNSHDKHAESHFHALKYPDVAAYTSPKRRKKDMHGDS